MGERLHRVFGGVSGILPSHLWRYTATPVAPRDFRAAAKATLPDFLWRYLEGPAGDGATYARNAEALAELLLRPRVLSGVSEIDTSVNIMGTTWSMPVGMAPIGAGGMFAYRGEVQGARAANKLNVPFCLSTVGVCSLGEVVKQTGMAPWFQLYVIRDQECRKALLQEAKDQGCNTLVFTVDMPVPGKRYGDVRPGGLAHSGVWGDFCRVAQGLAHPHWGANVGLLGTPHNLGNIAPFLKGKTALGDYFRWMRENFDPSIDWKILQSIRDNWEGKLVVKGIMDRQDASKALDYQIDGIVVSNHGGRQMDGASGTADVLPGIARTVKDKHPATAVLVDGGVRTGTDILRMRALGADAVLVGRPWIYALAAEGQRGIERWFKLVKQELETQMTLAGIGSVNEISRDNLVDRQSLRYAGMNLS